MSLNPKLLSFKVVFILNSSTVSLIAAIDGSYMEFVFINVWGVRKLYQKT
jgi:hypothetical protein